MGKFGSPLSDSLTSCPLALGLGMEGGWGNLNVSGLTSSYGHMNEQVAINITLTVHIKCGITLQQQTHQHSHISRCHDYRVYRLEL